MPNYRQNATVEVKRRILYFKRGLLEEYLDQCDFKQQAVFKKCFPGGPREEQIDQAIVLVASTVHKNKERQ